MVCGRLTTGGSPRTSSGGWKRESCVCPAGLERYPRLFAGENAHRAGVSFGADRRLQYRRRDDDARFRRRPRIRLVHARRRHGPRRDDRLAQSHRGRRSQNVSHAAVGAGCRLDSRATNISTTAGRFISRRARFCARRCSGLRTRGTPASSAPEIEWYLLRVADGPS